LSAQGSNDNGMPAIAIFNRGFDQSAKMPEPIAAIRFKQWLTDWDDVEYIASAQRKKPDPHILLFSMKANDLRSLSEPFRRQHPTSGGPALGIQRNLDEDRSALIRDYVRYGYPYSEMSVGRRSKYDLSDLRKPGWLPTAIVVNILTPTDRRRSRAVAEADLVHVRDTSNGSALIDLPSGFGGARAWRPKSLPPIEIIDGQHRLYAFEPEGNLPGNFELPVVAFQGLDLGWQAYLFWTINISPKRINRSHAFDLYPLLRTQDWLEKFDEAIVYREARAQEIVEFLYKHDKSVWRDRINMLGEGRERGRVSQAGWVRALLGTFLSPRYGLYGSNAGGSQPLAWSRAQQVAFLMMIWREFLESLLVSRANWASVLRSEAVTRDAEPAFTGIHSLLNQEQGMRAVLTATNDYFVFNIDAFELAAWELPTVGGSETTTEDVTTALNSLSRRTIRAHARQLMESLVKFDWRSSDAPRLSETDRRTKQAYRGSSGYGVIRTDLYVFLARQPGVVGRTFGEFVETSDDT
jgi:hypothetical protein